MIEIDTQAASWWLDFDYADLETENDCAEFERVINITIADIEKQMKIEEFKANTDEQDLPHFSALARAFAGAKSARKTAQARRTYIYRAKGDILRDDVTVYREKMLDFMERICIALERG